MADLNTNVRYIKGIGEAKAKSLGKLGIAICFDIRFSELFRVMGDKGAQLILIPAAFNMTTGAMRTAGK